MVNWISVEDELPPQDSWKRRVLVFKSNNNSTKTLIASIGHDGEWWGDQSVLLTKDSVTHWQPLPEPPA